MGIFEMYYLLNVSIVVVRCQFLKTILRRSYLNEKTWILGQENFIYLFFSKRVGNILICVMIF